MHSIQSNDFLVTRYLNEASKHIDSFINELNLILEKSNRLFDTLESSNIHIAQLSFPLLDLSVQIVEIFRQYSSSFNKFEISRKSSEQIAKLLSIIVEIAINTYRLIENTDTVLYFKLQRKICLIKKIINGNPDSSALKIPTPFPKYSPLMKSVFLGLEYAIIKMFLLFSVYIDITDKILKHISGQISCGILDKFLDEISGQFLNKFLDRMEEKQ